MACQFTFEERKVLHQLKKSGTSKAEMARVLGKHRSSIYRELERNTGGCGYRPLQAQRRAQERRERCRRPSKMSDPPMHEFVTKNLNRFWSPDQIEQHARREFPRHPERWISRVTIYNWIERERVDGDDWRPCLRRGGRHCGPTKRGQLKDCVAIEGRPQIINSRRRYGDWEGDTVVAKGHRGGLLTLVERKSGYTLLARLPNRRADTTRRAAKRILGKLPPQLRRSLTLDNGKEFAQHAKLAQQLNIAVYFARPGKPWERGSNENFNGLLRQYFPKGSELDRFSPREVARIERQLNDRPRRRLDYKSPAKVFQRKRVAIEG
jgi:transposase, IS30 family